MVEREGRDGGGILPRDRTVEGGGAQSSELESDLSRSVGLRRLPGPLLFDGRRDETWSPVALVGGESGSSRIRTAKFCRGGGALAFANQRSGHYGPDA